MRTRTALATLCVLLVTACSRTKPIVVGSKDSLEQQLLGEIIAQHLEKRLGKPVGRQLGIGDTRTVHQTLLDGSIALYPEYSGMIVSEILREPPSAIPSVTMERARQEMKRVELLEYIAPLGFNSPTAMVVRSAGNEAITLGTQAASSPTRWKIGISYEFQNRTTGLPSLNMYRLEMGAPMRSMKEEDLFKAMEDKDAPLDMVTASLSDGHLSVPTWKALEDNLSAFAPAEAAILVSSEALTTEPNLRGALLQLSGKISLSTMRKLNAQVAIEQRPISDVAAEFLKSAGMN